MLRDSEIEIKGDTSSSEIVTNPNATPFHLTIASTSKDCPATPGDLVFFQIEPRISVEGYTLAENNSSYLVDPTLSGEFWKCPFCPAVILSTNKKKAGRYAFLLVPLTTSSLEGAVSLKEIDIGLHASLSNLSAYGSLALSR